MVLGHLSYAAVGLAVGMESIGIPLPGETTLIAAAIYAGATHQMNIAAVVGVAAIAAIVGDNIGFFIGREFGFPLLVKYGRFIRMTEPRIKIGQYLFLRHGGKVVFFGRFVGILRTLSAFLAGANRLSWPRFLVANAAGGIVWAASYGFGAYFFGAMIHRFLGPIGLALGALLLVAIVLGAVCLKRHERRLEEVAEEALPGPIRQRHMHAAG